MNGMTKTYTLFIISAVACFTYLLSAHFYRNSDYVLEHPDVMAADKFMYRALIVTIFYSISGCILVMSDVEHYVCILCFCIPVCILGPWLSIQGLSLLRSSRSYNETAITSIVVKYWEEHRKVLPKLDAIQQGHKCCGLFSPSDYRSLIYNRNVLPLCEEEEFDVPVSCANWGHIHFKCHVKDDQRFCVRTYVFLRKAIIFKDDAINQLVALLPHVDQLRYKCANMSATNTILDSSGKRNHSIWEQGCMTYIMENAQSLRDSHYFFFFFVMIVSVIIGFTLVSYWYEAAQEALMRRTLNEEANRGKVGKHQSKNVFKKED